MAIIVMCEADTPGAFASLDWMRDIARQDNFKNDPWGSHPIYMYKFAEGCVVSKREMNGYDDSDFYATYYNVETDSFDEIQYASTRGWTYPNNATIDATLEIETKWEQHIEAKRAAYIKAEKAREARTPAKNKQVRILPNRGKAKEFVGAVGTIFWLQEQFSQYGTWSRGIRLGVAFPNGKRCFLMADKVEVIQQQ